MTEREMKFYLFSLLGLGLALVLSLGWGLWEHGTVKDLRRTLARRDTVKVTEVRIDTIRDTIPQLVSEKQVGVIKVPVTKDFSNRYFAELYQPKKEGVTTGAETLCQTITGSVTGVTDTIELPRMQRKYQDSTYTAWVSGYEPRLDSIEVYQKTIKETVTVSLGGTKKRRTFWQRFSLGVQTGYGIGLDDKKAHPYIGFGVGFNF